MDQHRQLSDLLRRAAQHFHALGHVDIWGSDYYADDLGKFCETAADRIETDGLCDEEKKKLWLIFAPTCEWDDSRGDIELGNQVFALLDSLYRDVVLRTGRQPNTSGGQVYPGDPGPPGPDT